MLSALAPHSRHNDHNPEKHNISLFINRLYAHEIQAGVLWPGILAFSDIQGVDQYQFNKSGQRSVNFLHSRKIQGQVEYCSRIRQTTCTKGSTEKGTAIDERKIFPGWLFRPRQARTGEY